MSHIWLDAISSEVVHFIRNLLNGTYCKWQESLVVVANRCSGFDQENQAVNIIKPRTLIPIIVLGAIALLASLCAASADSTPPAYNEVVESQPVADKGLGATVTATAHWQIPAKGSVSLVELQVLLTDYGDEDVVIPLMDTIWFHATDPAGKNVTTTGGRLRSTIVKPILIHRGQSYTVCFNAVIDTDSDGVNGLRYEDKSGMVSYSSPIVPGPYKIGFTISNAGYQDNHSIVYPPNTRIWTGTITTGDLSINVDGAPSN